MRDIIEHQGPIELGPLEIEQVPVVFRGAVAHWPSVERAKQSDAEIIEYIRSFSSSLAVTVYQLLAGQERRFFYNDAMDGFNFSATRMVLGDVLDKLASAIKGDGAGYYVGSTTLDKYLPGFTKQNTLDVIKDDALVSIWLGNEATIAAHFDAPNNIACCVAGRRRFTLFPPEEVANLYIGPLEKTPSGQSISLFNPKEQEKFPKFLEALKGAYIVELNPGDAIYIPPMWWHQVEALSTFNVLVNYWWRDVPRFKGPGLDALVHAMLNIRDLPIAERKAWRALFEYYVFSNQEGKFDYIPEGARGFLGELDDRKSRQIRAWLLNRLNQ